MEKMNLLSIPLDDRAIDVVDYDANDEFFCGDNCNLVFFFGKLVNEFPFGENIINEHKYYTLCPNCSELIQLKKKPLDGEPYTCPHCSSSGTLYDYRDPNSSVNNNDVLHYGHLEKLDKGYVLRLFDIWLDYSDRDMSDYTSIDCIPMMIVLEVGREYWYEGKVEYFKVASDDPENPIFIAADTVDDLEYVIVNYFDEHDDYCSQRVDDIICRYSFAKTFMEMISKRGSYRAFNTLNKYGFEQLTFDYLYGPDNFGDSKKISEVLKLDYNQVISDINACDLSMDMLLTMRELADYGLELSRKNVQIMSILSNRFPFVYTAENIKKTFKYLRNQMSRTKSVDVVRDFYDYISDCRKLGLNIENSEIRYPTDLQRAHERSSALVRIEANRDTDERIREVYNRCHNACEWSDGVYCIIMPTCCEDIIREGKDQSHCVGSYCERMANGEDIILFLRKVAEPNKAFYTIEIRPSLKKLELVQCRGYRNRDENEQVRAAVDEFLKCYKTWFNSRKCNDIGNMRRKYYKAVCKSPDGRFISYWDNKTEYRIGEIIESCVEPNPDLTAVQGIHIASLDFAKRYGDDWENAAILEIEVDMRDVVIPDAKDQLRTKRGKVLREVPMSELGDWGVRHSASFISAR